MGAVRIYPQGAAINQWPVTTTRIETALRKSTQRFRFAGVFSASLAAALQGDFISPHHAILIHRTNVATFGGFPCMRSPTRNTFAANQSAA